ncbi:MAG: hypothetical protein R3C45_22295 [Phycisphaerales bacterium]
MKELRCGPSLSILDFTITLFAYLGGIMLMGLWTSRKNTNTEEYFVGGRSFPGWAIGLSMVGTSISSVTFLAFPADAYKTAWLRFLPNLMLPFAILIAAYAIPAVLPPRQPDHGLRIPRRALRPVGTYLRGFGIYHRATLPHQHYSLSGIGGRLSDDRAGPRLVCHYRRRVCRLLHDRRRYRGGGLDGVVQTLVLVAGLICMGYIVSHLPGGLGRVFEIAGEHNKFAIAEVIDGRVQTAYWDLSLEAGR